tara:strand:+ start:53 stop:592 length:540 start_codon:yes stop_codon:yes gene_type:complete
MSNYYKNGKCYKHIKHNTGFVWEVKCAGCGRKCGKEECPFDTGYDNNEDFICDNCPTEVVCVCCAEPVCGMDEEPPHKDLRGEAVCHECWTDYGIGDMEADMVADAEAEELGLCDSEDVESKDTEAHLKIIKDAMAVFKCGTCDNIGIYERKWTINGKSGIQRLCRECKQEDECAVEAY